MTLYRVLVSAGILLIVGWCLAITAQVLSDEQISADMALNIVLATAIIPSFIGVCVGGLLWPVVRDTIGQSPDYADKPLGQDGKADGWRSLKRTVRH
jgi:ABC-type branched-subunit amino acid transport system permease subunit